MRTHVIWLSCSLGLIACLPSAFDDAERRERERAAVDSLTVEAGTSAVEGGSAGATKAGAGRGGVVVSGAGRAGAGGRAAAAGSGGSGALTCATASGGTGAASCAAGRGGAGAVASAAGGASGATASGAAGTAGENAAAVSGGAGAADSGEAGAAGGDSGCGDISSDAANCGACGNDCSADMALASCADSHCVRACKSGFGDCNMDLRFGTQGDGCEVDLSADLTHCGGCDVRCEPQPGTVSFCEDRQCKLRAIEVGVGSPVADLHGNASGGDPYEEVCGRGEALIGIDVATNGDYIWGLAVRCAPLLLRGTADAVSVEAGSSHALVLLGNRAEPMQTPMTLECPTGMLVSGVSGATGYFAPDNQLLSVKTLSLLCARTRVNGANVELEPGSTQSAGSLMGNLAEPFADVCSAGEVVVGFTGRAGHVIDAMTTVCAPLQIAPRLQ